MQPSNSKYLNPELNTPYTVAFKYPNPIPVTGFDGPQFRYILVDGRALYVPKSLKPQIDALGLRQGQRFRIEKRKKGREAEWLVTHLSDLPQQRPQPAATLFTQASPLDEPEGMGNPDPQPASKRPQTALEAALKTAVTAAAEAERHAEQLGYACRFSSADIRAMGISVLISMGRAA